MISTLAKKEGERNIILIVKRHQTGLGLSSDTAVVGLQQCVGRGTALAMQANWSGKEMSPVTSLKNVSLFNLGLTSLR